jgi:hypothetical protein
VTKAIKYGTCVCCGQSHRLGPFGRVGVHPDASVSRVFVLPCRGVGRLPKERGDALRKTSHRKRTAQVAALRDEASIMLDALLDPRYASKTDDLFPGRLHILIRGALLDLRLKGAHYYLPWRSTRLTGRPVRHALFCTFCSEVMAPEVPETSMSLLFAHLKAPRAKQVELEEGRHGGIALAIREHYEVCALSCLVGMKQYTIANTLKLERVITCGYEPCDNGPCLYPKEHAARDTRVVTDEDVFDGDSP